MARKGSQQVEKGTPSCLVEPRNIAAEKLKKQIERGRQIHAVEVSTHEKLDELRRQFRAWEKYCSELLMRLFNGPSMATEFNRQDSYGFISLGPSVLYEDIKEFKSDVLSKIDRLESIVERLELIPESETACGPNDQKGKVVGSAGKKIFIVHGHDEAAKLAVSRFVEKLDLVPIILHEQPNAGQTIIEKFEVHANVNYAIAILSPDDQCGRNDEKVASRARQNVIFEFGFFVGKIGRSNVCALYKQGVELPSDIHGVLYVPMDTEDGWKFKLAKELKQAGYPVDLNKVI